MQKYFYASVFASIALHLPASAAVRSITFPINGTSSFRNDFSEPRANGAREHLGIDIIATKMTPVVAAIDGTVSYVVSPQASWGYSISIRDAEGYQYRYLHLNNDVPGTDDGKGGEANAYAPGVRRGVKVAKGDVLGWVGDSGNAEATVSHLHFEIRDPKRIPINPYESLLAAVASSTHNIAVRDANSAITTQPQNGEGADTELASTYEFTKPLSVGSRGEEVRELQMRLKALKYFFYPEITSYFGSVTENAVVDFQRANSIDPIGIVGPKTRAALNSV
jgi:hypothetical protein